MIKVKQFIDKWGLIISIGLMLLIAFFVILTFNKTKSQDDTDYKEKVALLERERKAIIDERTALNYLLAQHDKSIKALAKIDSLISVNIVTNNKTLYEIKKQRETITRIDKFNSGELKKYFTDLR